jgi:hypothetical protein
MQYKNGKVIIMMFKNNMKSKRNIDVMLDMNKRFFHYRGYIIANQKLIATINRRNTNSFSILSHF